MNIKKTTDFQPIDSNLDTLLRQSVNVINRPMSKRKAIEAAYTVTTENLIAVNTTGQAITVTLPAALTAKDMLVIVKDEGGNAGTNNITVTTQNGEALDAGTSVTISSNYGVSRLYSNGTKWLTF